MLWMLNEETHKHSKSKAKTQHKPIHNKALVTNNFIYKRKLDKQNAIN